MFNRAFLFAGIFLGLAACVEAQDVYSTGVQIINPGFVLTNPEVWGYLGPNFSVAGGYALMSIDPNLNLRYMGSSLGQIGVFCKIVNPGDVVNTGWIASNLPTGFPFQMTLNQPFLLGLELGSTHFDSTGHGYTTMDRFGWAELEYTSSGLTLLDSELAYNGLGIIAGTTTVVPEPSSTSILLSGIIAVALLRRRRAKR